MSISLPSREIYAVDVPEIVRFTGNFQYNFFTPDESVSETGGVPAQILQRDAEEVDAAFIQYAVTRAPRVVVFSWKLPRLVDPGNQVTDLQRRNLVFSTNAQNGSLIADNIDKVVTEDHFSSNNYVAATFHDGEIDDKVHYLVSGSYAMHTLDEEHDHNVSHYKAAHRLSSMTPKHIKPHFLFRSLSLPSRAHGTRFFRAGGQRIFNHYFRRLKEVATNAQINGKLFHDITNRSIRDPHSPFATDMHNLHKYTKKLRHQVLQRSSVQVAESDFKSFVPFIDLKVRRTAHHHDHHGAEIVGYIIDKIEVTRDGSTRHMPPLIVDNPRVNLTADFRVKYNATYVYTIRTVAQFTIPAIDDDNGDVAMVKVLVSSKPSNKIYVQTTEAVAPPAPADLNFTWDYDRINPTTAQHDPTTGEPLPGTGKPGSLLIHWTFPPNSQRDVKKFQVFRRRSIHHPFELIKMFNFDDSMVKFPDHETPDPDLVENLTSPCTFFYDDDFHVGDHNFHDPHANQLYKDEEEGTFGIKGPEKHHHAGSSTYIYAVACIDAHGFTSGYSAQFEVWFDQFKNRLQKRLVSHAGAPKPYPNLYLEADTFIDTIHIGGPHSKRLKVYFNPEFYHIYDDNERLQRVIATRQTGGSYKLQFINTDNQKSAATEIVVNDMVRAASKTLAFPEVRFGGRKSPTPKRIINH